MQLVEDEGFGASNLVIGKPYLPKDAGNGWMYMKDLGEAVVDLVKQIKWSAGFSFWQTPMKLQDLEDLKQASGLE